MPGMERTETRLAFQARTVALMAAMEEAMVTVALACLLPVVREWLLMYV